MRATGFAAIMLVAVSAGAAHAEWNDPDWARNFSRRVEAMAQTEASQPGRKQFIRLGLHTDRQQVARQTAVRHGQSWAYGVQTGGPTRDRPTRVRRSAPRPYVPHR